MLKLGSQGVSAIRLGGAEIKKAYLGAALVFDSEPLVPSYAITASIAPAGSGTVSGAGVYQEGKAVTVTALPGDGYQFTAWQENGVTVSGDAAYTFTAAGDRNLTAVFQAVKTSRLPEGYTEVEYLSNGTSTNTNYTPRIDMPDRTTAVKFEIKFAPMNDVGSTMKAIYGYDNSSSSTVRNYTLGTYIGAIYYQRGANTASDRVYIGTAETGSIYTVTVDSIAKTISVNGETKSFTTRTDWRTKNNRLFGVKSIGSEATAAYVMYNARVYWVKMWDESGALVLDMIPCVDPSGVAKMYDAASKTVYSNSNTKANVNNKFIPGPAV